MIQFEHVWTIFIDSLLRFNLTLQIALSNGKQMLMANFFDQTNFSDICLMPDFKTVPLPGY